MAHCHEGGKLQHAVRVDGPDPVFVGALRRAIGGVHDEAQSDPMAAAIGRGACR